MATVNYSVPEPVKAAFNRVFAGRNKSGIIADLMQRAVEEEEVRARRTQAVEELIALRGAGPTVRPDEAEAVRAEGRQWP